MTDFKVGDRVRLTGDDWYGGAGDPEKGDIVEVTRVSLGGIPWFDWSGEEWFLDDEGYNAELVTAAPEEEAPVVEVTYAGGWDSPDPISPDHYQFPGGVEVRQISAHLTSFGGQAVQYVARATRLDGKNKGDQIENLKKAQKMIAWEIERLEAAK